MTWDNAWRPAWEICSDFTWVGAQTGDFYCWLGQARPLTPLVARLLRLKPDTEHLHSWPPRYREAFGL